MTAGNPKPRIEGRRLVYIGRVFATSAKMRLKAFGHDTGGFICLYVSGSSFLLAPAPWFIAVVDSMEVSTFLLGAIVLILQMLSEAPELLMDLIRTHHWWFPLLVWLIPTQVWLVLRSLFWLGVLKPSPRQVQRNLQSNRALQVERKEILNVGMRENRLNPRKVQLKFQLEVNVLTLEMSWKKLDRLQEHLHLPVSGPET